MKAINRACTCLLILALQTAIAPSSSYSKPASNPLDHGGKIESRYDGFSRETIVALKKMRVTCGGAKSLQSALNQTCVSLAASLHCPGVQLDYVRYAKLQLIFETKDWDKRHPVDERDLFVVADGQTLKLGKMKLVNQDVGTNKLVDVMKEVLEVSLHYQAFSKIAGASDVEMKVGKTAFPLQRKNIEALRDLNNRVNFRQG